MKSLSTSGAAGCVRGKRARANPWARQLAASLALMAAAVPASAQQRATLTLEEAIRLARQNNPLYRQSVNDERDADWDVRQSLANFVPGVTASQSFSYTAAGTPTVGGVSGSDLGLNERPATYSSRYSIGAGLTISGQNFFEVARSRANQAQTEARISADGFNLDNAVTAQYLAAMGARDGVTIAQTALDAATQAFRLADARFQAGAVTRIDLATSEVARGRAEIALIQAQNLYDTERVRLMQQLGVELNTDIELTTTFEVFEPRWTQEELVARALQSHPQLISAKKAESAANASARASWSQYLPSLNFFGALWAGNVSRQGSDEYVVAQARGRADNQVSNCESNNALNARLTSPLPGWPRDCSTLAYTDAMGQAAIAQNNLYPFNFTKSPMFLQVQISVPVFNGFQRERQLQAARARADDAKYARRAEELLRRTDVTTNLLNLRAAYRTVELEQKNVAMAGDALSLAQERYRLGAAQGSIIELTQAQDVKARADQSYLSALYTFHRTLAALEAAAGFTLRETAATGRLDAPTQER